MNSDDFDRWEEGRRERRREREARREERRRARQEGDPGSGGRKERVLHTRIPERLAEDIRKVADELRVPVSNVVRNVLEDVFSVVEAVTDNVGDIVEEVLEEADRAREKVARHSRRAPRRAQGSELEGEPNESEAEPTPLPPRPDLPEFPGVLGWQPLLLNAPQVCAGCARELKHGNRVYVGVTTTGLCSTYLCIRCSRGVTTPD